SPTAPDHRHPGAAVSCALRRRLVDRSLDGRGCPPDPSSASSAVDGGSHGQEANVLQRGEGSPRAGLAPNTGRRRPLRRRRVVRRARIRAETPLSSAPRSGRAARADERGTGAGATQGGNAGQFVARRTRKSRSNFFYAFLCLPRLQREAIFAVYAFCRIVDDAVDLGRDREEQQRVLQEWREEIARVYGGTPQHPAAQRLQDA